MRAANQLVVIVTAALTASACVNKPDGFGVAVEARTSMLPSATQKSIVNARVIVSGAETFAKDIPNAAKAAQSGAFKFRYVPGVHAGTITIRVDGLDGGGNTVAAGISPPINLVDGKSVDAVFFLATNGNGVPCMTSTDCISNNCVDGVCCESTCDGVCETCNLPGQPGVCNPQPDGMDPDSDCVAKQPMTPGDVDGGTDVDGGMSLPAGDNVAACGGTCNGMRACNFADTTTSCGTSICAADATVGRFFCDGNGGCVEKDSACTDYNCNMGACRTLCNADSDCQPTDFCNLNINKCVPKHDIGTPCAMGNECKTGDCYSGVCCNTTCGDSTQSCNNPGSVGQCQCTGHACPAGVACVLFYRDNDKDGFGDATATLTNGRAVAGCTGDTPPTIGNVPYRTDNTDCDDGDANAFPGQTAYFDHPSAGTGSFDYNCDGNPNEKQFGEYLNGCNFCNFDPNSFRCFTNLPTCGTVNSQSALSCGRFKTSLCYPLVTSGFTVTVACGQSHSTVNCGTCTVANGGPTTSVGPNQTQLCH